LSLGKPRNNFVGFAWPDRDRGIPSEMEGSHVEVRTNVIGWGQIKLWPRFRSCQMGDSLLLGY